MSFTDFETPDSMQGVAPGRYFDPIPPPGDWGEPPPEMALPPKDRDPYAPGPIPTDPDAIIGFRQPRYQDIFDPGIPLPPPGGGFPPGPWSGIPGILGGGPLFGLGLLAVPYVAITAWAWAYEHPLPPRDNNPYPITPMDPLFGNPQFAPIAPLPGLPITPNQADYEPGGLPSYQTAPPIQALSTAPSFTDTSPNLMGGITEISDGVL